MPRCTAPARFPTVVIRSWQPGHINTLNPGVQSTTEQLSGSLCASTRVLKVLPKAAVATMKSASACVCPLINYFKEEKARTAVSNKEINQTTVTQMASHWFTASQWQLPNAEQYQKLQALFTQKALMTRWRLRLETELVALQRQYQGLAQEFDDLNSGERSHYKNNERDGKDKRYQPSRVQ